MVVRVTIKSLNDLYAEKIKTAVFDAIRTALGQARAEATEYVKRYWPRDTGHYMDDVLGTMRLDAADENPWTIQVGAEDTPYAGFVNRMHGVNWGSGGPMGNKAAVEGAQGLLVMFLRQLARQLVRQAIIDTINYATYQQQVKIANA